MKPFRQGELDGLCGIYSALNATNLSSGHHIKKEIFEIIFQECLLALGSKHPVEDIIVYGVNLHGMCRLLRDVIPLHCPLKYRRPFYRTAQKPLTDYWRALRLFLDGTPGRAVITALETKDFGHWTVIGSISKRRLNLFDSTGMKTINRSRCTTGRTTKVRTTRLYPTHTFFITMNSNGGRKP